MMSMVETTVILSLNMKAKPKNFILDVDGVMTSGQFIYSVEGKSYKIFGPHDSDGLKMLKDKLNIEFITADHRGFKISEKRIVQDMGYKLTLMSEEERLNLFNEKFNYKESIYMADGYYDAVILKKTLFGIAPKNARKEAIESADFVTESIAGNGAVMDACLEIKKKFFD